MPPAKRRKIEQVEVVVAVDFSAPSLLPLEVLWLIMDELPMESLWCLCNTSARLRALVKDYLNFYKALTDDDKSWIHDQAVHCYTKTQSVDGLQFWLDFGLHDVGNELLQMAVEDNSLAVAEMLLLKAEENIDNGILMIAVKYLFPDMVRLLLKYRTTDARTSSGTLVEAVKLRHFKIVRMLLEHGGEVDAAQALLCAVQTNNLEMVNLLLEFHAQFDDYCVITAVSQGNYAIVKVLLEHGADMLVALREAAFYGQTRTVGLLLTKGANVNANIGNPTAALEYASGNGHERIVQMLLSKGAHISPETLRRAAIKGNATIVKLLIVHGADVRAHQSVALRHAAERGCDEVIRLLIAHGANVNARKGEPLMEAVVGRHYNVVKLLLENRGNVPAYMHKALVQCVNSPEITQLLVDFGAGAVRRSERKEVSIIFFIKKNKNLFANVVFHPHSRQMRIFQDQSLRSEFSRRRVSWMLRYRSR